MAFFSTDMNATVAEILAAVADRFSPEFTFRDRKEIVGVGQQQLRFVWANICAFHSCPYTFTMAEAQVRAEADLVVRKESPWDDPNRRPSHANKSLAWRRELPAEEIRAVLRPRVTGDKVQAVAEWLLSVAAWKWRKSRKVKENWTGCTWIALSFVTYAAGQPTRMLTDHARPCAARKSTQSEFLIAAVFNRSWRR